MLEILNYQSPSWAKSLSWIPKQRVRLAHTPTPLTPWKLSTFQEMGISFWLKHDQNTGCELSGNKIRKLEFLLGEAKQQEKDFVITCGGIQSNHCRATSVASRMLNMDSSVFLRTNDKNLRSGWNGNLLFHRMIGAEIHWIDSKQYQNRNHLMQEYAQQMEEKGRLPYIIPEGGSNALGTWGYIDFVQELEQQFHSTGWVPSDLFIACGSGGTAAGIALGVYLAGLPIQVHAINVCDSAEYFYGIINGIYEKLGFPKKAEDILDIVDGYKGLGYALNRPEELRWIQQIACETGILLDPVYTGKAMFGIREEWIEQPERFRGNQWLFVHTGGLFGIYDKMQEFSSL